jgi:tetratricopeptide (TPR) repeat protein
MKYFSSLRTLLVIYTAAALFAVVEIAFIRGGLHRRVEENVNRLEVMERLAETNHDLYPQRGTSHYMRGAIAFRRDDRKLALDHFERALALNDHGENVLYDYSVNLVLQDADPQKVNQAIKNWRWYYPTSRRPDPRTAKNPVEKNPVDTADYLAGLRAFRKLEFAAARHHFEKDLAAGSQTEQLFYNYALALLFLDADDERIDSAIAQWRHAYSNSTRDDPRTAYERLVQSR